MIFSADDLIDLNYEDDESSCVYDYEDFYDNSKTFKGFSEDSPCLYMKDYDWEWDD